MQRPGTGRSAASSRSRSEKLWRVCITSSCSNRPALRGRKSSTPRSGRSASRPRCSCCCCSRFQDSVRYAPPGRRSAPALHAGRSPSADPAWLGRDSGSCSALPSLSALAVPGARYAAAASSCSLGPSWLPPSKRSRRNLFHLALLACLVLSPTRTSDFLADVNAPQNSKSARSCAPRPRRTRRCGRVPPGVREVYVMLGERPRHRKRGLSSRISRH